MKRSLLAAAAATVLLAPSTAAAQDVRRDFTATITATETHDWTTEGPALDDTCHNGSRATRGAGREAWTFRTPRPVRVRLTSVNSRYGSTLVRSGSGGWEKGLVTMAASSERSGRAEVYTCEAPDYEPRYTPAPLDGCLGRESWKGLGELSIGGGTVAFRGTLEDAWPRCGWRSWTTITTGNGELFSAVGRLPTRRLLHARRAFTVKLRGTGDCSTAYAGSRCGGTVAAIVRLTPRRRRR